MSLQEVEKVSITILMDNSTDFLLTDSAHAKRPPLIVNEKFNLPVPFKFYVTRLHQSIQRCQKGEYTL